MLRFRCYEVDPIMTDKNWHRNSLAVSICSDLTRQPKRPYSTPCLSAFQLHIADLGYSSLLPYYIVCICQVNAVGLHMTGLESCDSRLVQTRTQAASSKLNFALWEWTSALKFENQLDFLYPPYGGYMDKAGQPSPVYLDYLRDIKS